MDVDGLYLALEDERADGLAWQALADWHEDEGRTQDASCLRWLWRRGFVPFRFSPALVAVHSGSFHDGWSWWATDDPSAGRGWGLPAGCRLPAPLWGLLRHTFRYPPLVIKEYPTVRAAAEAVLEAWPLYNPLGRERA